MKPTFVWIYPVGDEWISEVFTGEDRLDAANKVAERVLELDMKGEGVLLEPESYLAGINEAKRKATDT